MRCPDCNKFVSYDTDNEPELDLSIDEETGSVSGTARIVNCCAECGNELKEATLDIEIDLSAEFLQHVEEVNAALVKKRKAPPKHEAVILNEEGSRTDRVQRTDRKGRPIRSSRYMKSFYGADVSVTIGCTCDGGKGFEAAGSASNECQASGMDELV